VKRSIFKNLIKVALTYSLIAGFVFAQYTKGNTVMAWSKYKWKDWSEVENPSGKDWRESIENYHVTRHKAAKILNSSMMLTHYWSGSSEDVHFINEFDNMEDATAYSGSQAPLNKKAWPDEEERKAALSAYNKYFQSYHEDLHIFENHVAFRKKAKKKDRPDATVVTAVTSYWKPLRDVEGGSAEEREKLMKKFFRTVTKKNDKILSQRVVTHLWSGHVENGLWPLTYIREYATMVDANDSSTENELINKAFKTDEEKQAYGKYWARKHDDIGVYWNQTYTNK
tara:strand:+ start:137 stop:985 length:849 start_codon:yes stop_codon:yes gene_type:complete